MRTYITVLGEERNYEKYIRKPYKESLSKPKCLKCDAKLISVFTTLNGKYEKLGWLCRLCKYIYIFKGGYTTFKVEWKDSTTGNLLGMNEEVNEDGKK
jgi:hypothetical protein